MHLLKGLTHSFKQFCFFFFGKVSEKMGKDNLSLGGKPNQDRGPNLLKQNAAEARKQQLTQNQMQAQDLWVRVKIKERFYFTYRYKNFSIL